MLEGSRERDWETMSHLMAMIANVNRNPKKRHKPFSASEFNPTLVAKAVPVTPQNWSIAKQVFNNIYGKKK